MSSIGGAKASAQRLTYAWQQISDLSSWSRMTSRPRAFLCEQLAADGYRVLVLRARAAYRV